MSRKFFDVPLLRYTGAKWKLADWVISQLGCIGLHRVCGGAKLKDLTRIRPNRAGVREWTPEVRV